MSNRILPEEVAKAVESNTEGLVNRAFVKIKDDHSICMCALSHVYMARTRSRGWPVNYSQVNDTRNIKDELEISESYMRGYIRGFDGLPRSEGVPDDWLQGYKDGCAALMQLEHLIL